MRKLLLRRRMASSDKDLQAALLEIRARRWYRTRPIRDLKVVEVEGIMLCHADYDFEGRSIHVVLAFTPFCGHQRSGRRRRQPTWPMWTRAATRSSTS